MPIALAILAGCPAAAAITVDAGRRWRGPGLGDVDLSGPSKHYCYDVLASGLNAPTKFDNWGVSGWATIWTGALPTGVLVSCGKECDAIGFASVGLGGDQVSVFVQPANKTGHDNTVGFGNASVEKVVVECVAVECAEGEVGFED